MRMEFFETSNSIPVAQLEQIDGSSILDNWHQFLKSDGVLCYH